MRSLAFVLTLAMSFIAAPAQDSSIDIPQILSDTQGYNFIPYMNSLMKGVRKEWIAVIPDIARRGEKGRAVITFTIVRDGKIEDLRLTLSAGNQAFDSAAEAAIRNSSPLPPLPDGFKGDRLVLRLSFLYNLKAGDK